MAKAKLIPDDDAQLWVYSDQGWDIPVCAQPCHIEGGHSNLMAVWPALLMPAEPTRIVTMAMQARDAAQGTGCWVLSADKFSACAAKCNGITPAYYYRKDGIRVDATETRDIAVELSEPSAPEEIDTSSIARLAKFLSGRTALFTAKEAETVLRSLAALANEILIKRMRPIDLGFCVIRAVPLRVGWQALVHNAHPVRPPVTDERIEHEITNCGLADVTLCSADLMHTTKQGEGATIHWNLEVEWSGAAERAMLAYERDKLDTYGQTEYAAGHARIIHKLSNTLIEMWRSWIRKASAARGSVSDVGTGGGQRIGSKRGVGRLSTISLEQPILRLGNIEKNWFTRRQRLALPPAPPDMPKVPNVQPPIALLRDAGGDVSGGRGDETDRLLVPHATEGEPEDKVLDI